MASTCIRKHLANGSPIPVEQAFFRAMLAWWQDRWPIPNPSLTSCRQFPALSLCGFEGTRLYDLLESVCRNSGWDSRLATCPALMPARPEEGLFCHLLAIGHKMLPHVGASHEHW